MIDTGPGFIGDYLAKIWSSGGDGPKDFNCYNLVRDVYRTQWGIDLPRQMVDASDLRRLIKDIGSEIKSSIWEEKDAPEHGSVVLYSYRIAPTHIAIWLSYDGGVVLQASKGLNVTCTPSETLKQYGYTRPRFFNYVG